MTIAKCHCRPILKSKGKQYTFVSDHPEEERTVYLDDLTRDVKAQSEAADGWCRSADRISLRCG